MNESNRLELMQTIVADPPRVHSNAPGGVWSTSEDCYRFIAKYLPEAARTLETGCGISTALLTAWGATHTCVVPSEKQELAIREYLHGRGISDQKLTFDLRPSQIALPAMMSDGEVDLVLIDGCHGFPIPIIDWFYSANRLVAGGIMIIDDVQLPQLTALIAFLDADPRWQPMEVSTKWRSYRRIHSGGISEEWTSQAFLGRPRTDSSSFKSTAYAALPEPLKSPAKNLVRAFRGWVAPHRKT